MIKKSTHSRVCVWLWNRTYIASYCFLHFILRINTNTYRDGIGAIIPKIVSIIYTRKAPCVYECIYFICAVFNFYAQLRVEMDWRALSKKHETYEMNEYDFIQTNYSGLRSISLIGLGPNNSPYFVLYVQNTYMHIRSSISNKCCRWVFWRVPWKFQQKNEQ